MLQRTYSIGSLGPARSRDVDRLAPRLRASDLVELERLDGSDPHEVLTRSLANAKFALTIRDRDGHAVSMLGVGWLANPRAGVAWFLSSDALDRFALVFLQEVRDNIDALMAGHDVISNYIHAPNVKTIRWLRWLGFEVLSERTSPHSGDTFLEMARFASPAIRDLYVERDWSAFVSTLPDGSAADMAAARRSATRSGA